MGISPHVARLRAAVGHELLVLPCVTVLPVDDQGRLLLAMHAGHTDGWGTVGGAVDPGESAAQAAVREAREEITGGTPAPADGELSEVAWFTRMELRSIPLSRFTRALLGATGWLTRPGTGPSSGAL